MDRNWFIFRFHGKYYRYRGTVFGTSSMPRSLTKIFTPDLWVSEIFWPAFGDIYGRFIGYEWVVCSMCSRYTRCDNCSDVVSTVRLCDFDQGTGSVGAKPSGSVVWSRNFKSDDDVCLKFRKIEKASNQVSQNNQVLRLRGSVDSEAMGVCPRFDAVHHGLRLARPAVQSGGATVRQLGNYARQEVLGSSDAPASVGSPRESAPLHGQIVPHVQRPSNTAIAGGPSHRLRRERQLRWWDGSYVSRAPRSALALAARRAPEAHQSQGISHSLAGFASAGPGSAGPRVERDDLQSLRQYGVGFLREPPGRTHPGAQLRSGSSVVLAPRAGFVDQGRLPARSAKRGGGYRQPLVHQRRRVHAPSRTISKTQLSVRPVHGGRLRIARELSDAAVLVPLGRSGFSRPSGRSRQGLAGAQSVSEPDVPSDPSSPDNSHGSRSHSSNAGRTNVANSALVAAPSANVAGSPVPGPSAGGDATPDPTDATVADTFMEHGGIQALREMLQRQGYDPSTINRLVGRYELKETTSTLNRHRRTWDNSFVPWCRQNGFNPYEYDLVRFTNYLNMIQVKYEGQQEARGVAKNHAMFKHARAAIGAFMLLFHPEKPAVADHPPIQHIARGLRVTAPNLPKYSETISLDPIFDALIKAYQKGIRHESVDLKSLRDWTIALVRIRLRGRSADVVAINWVWTDDPAQSHLACLAGTSPMASDLSHPVDVNKVRYDFPKNFRSRARFSAWKPIGPFLCDQPGFQPEFSLCCPRFALNVYMRRVSGLPVEPFIDPVRPAEEIPRLFLSSVRRHGKYFPIKSSTAASLVKSILEELGFDVSKFQAHILRSASIVAGIASGEPVDSVLAQASVSAKVFSIFYDLPLQAPTAAPVLDSGSGFHQRQAAKRKASNALSLFNSVNVPVLGSGLQLAPSVARPPSNQDETSGTFSGLRLMLRADREG